MHIEVDQSGKIENTRVDTVLAFADGESHAILIPAAVKRRCLHILRERGVKPKMITIRMFAATLSILLVPYAKDISAATIDTEYRGWEGEILGLLLTRLREHAPDFPDQHLRFGHIGKQSPAHRLALATFRRQSVPDRRITLEELLRRC